MAEGVRFIPVRLPNGAIIRVDTSMTPREREAEDIEEDVADVEEDVAFGLPPFSDLIAPIEGIATTISSVIDKVKPKKTSVEFGIEVSGEPGKLTALLVKGSGKANLKITLEWGG